MLAGLDRRKPNRLFLFQEEIMTTQKDPTKLQELPEISMQGPIEITMTVHCVTTDGKNARMELFLEPGIIPNQERLQYLLDSSRVGLKDEVGDIPAGTRMMTKPEFVAHITKRGTGQAIPMPGSQEFEPIHKPVTATKKMLVHAILGCDGLDYFDEDKWERGLCEDIGGNAVWIKSKLVNLEESQLLELYNEITGV